MIFVMAGIGLIVSALRFYVSEFANSLGTLPSFHQLQHGELPISMRPALLVCLLGVIFVLLGLVAIALGVDQHWNGRYLLLAAMAVFSLSVQTRLIFYGLKKKSAKDDRNNLFSTFRKAFSVGFFPSGNLFLRALVQVFQLLTIFAFGAYLYF